jgi:hypothetical protein
MAILPRIESATEAEIQYAVNVIRVAAVVREKGEFASGSDPERSTGIPAFQVLTFGRV